MLIERNGKLFRRYDKELLCIEPYGVNGLRIRATELADFQDDTLSALIEPEHKTYDTEIAIEGDSACIRNGKLRCEVLCTGKMKFYNQKGEPPSAQCAGGGRQCTGNYSKDIYSTPGNK